MCVQERERGMSSSGTVWVRAGVHAIYLEETSSVCERGVRERESARERQMEVDCVRKWPIDRETRSMVFESGLCRETRGKRVIVCVRETS